MKALALLGVLTLACGNDCDELRDHVMRRLGEEVNRGVLFGNAVPCGEDGVQNRRDSFMPGTPPSVVESIQSEFRSLCADYTERECG